jgi:uncharacterized membrane protein
VALSLRASVAIRAPQPHLFELIATPERLPEWNVSIERACRAVAGEPVGIGSRAIFSGRLLGQPLESETEVVIFEPPRLFVTRAIRGPRLTTRFSLDIVGDGTRVDVDVSGDVPGGAIGARLAEGFLRKELTASLERLRALCESASRPG